MSRMMDLTFLTVNYNIVNNTIIRVWYVYNIYYLGPGWLARIASCRIKLKTCRCSIAKIKKLGSQIIVYKNKFHLWITY